MHSVTNHINSVAAPAYIPALQVSFSILLAKFSTKILRASFIAQFAIFISEVAHFIAGAFYLKTDSVKCAVAAFFKIRTSFLVLKLAASRPL